MNKTAPWILLVVLLAAGCRSMQQLPGKSPSSGGSAADAQSAETSPPLPLQYRNTTYNFTFSLPASWIGFTILAGSWEGYTNLDAVVVRGSMIIIRHPPVASKLPYQDIPIMVFSLAQWNDLKNDQFHVSEAGADPEELGRNSKYVFALLPRYDAADAEGIPEVSNIISENPWHGF